MMKIREILGMTPKNMLRPEDLPKKGKLTYVQYSKGRITPSVDDFVNAVESAMNKMVQSRTRLYNLYEQTFIFDYFFSSLMTKRLNNIERKKLVIMDGETPFEDSIYFLESPKFKQFMRDILLTKFWGMNLFEFRKTQDREGRAWFDYNLIPIKHVNPYRKEVLPYEHNASGMSYERPDCMFLGDPDDLGIMLRVTLLSIYRRLGLHNYGNYIDLASENFTQLITRDYGDNQGMNSLQKALKERGGGGVLTLPQGMEVRTENQSSSQQNQLFADYMKMLKEEMAILILGQTMTTEDGSSRSQAEVHQEEQGHIFDGDEKHLLDVLNFDFYDYMKIWGFDMTPSCRFELLPREAKVNQNEIAAAENRKAQATLRGSEGGVTSLIDVKRSVSEGLVSPKSAIAVLINIYGFNETIAKEIIGS